MLGKKEGRKERKERGREKGKKKGRKEQNGKVNLDCAICKCLCFSFAWETIHVLAKELVRMRTRVYFSRLTPKTLTARCQWLAV